MAGSGGRESGFVVAGGNDARLHPHTPKRGAIGDAASHRAKLLVGKHAARYQPRSALALGFIQRVAEINDTSRRIGAEAIERGKCTHIRAHDVQTRDPVRAGLKRASAEDVVDARQVDALGK